MLDNKWSAAPCFKPEWARPEFAHVDKETGQLVADGKHAARSSPQQRSEARRGNVADIKSGRDERLRKFSVRRFVWWVLAFLNSFLNLGLPMLEFCLRLGKLLRIGNACSLYI